MIIYKDIISGDEIISDTYNLKDIDDVVYEVDCRKVTKGADNVDIGANPSAEEAEETMEEGTKQVIDVVDGFRYNFYGNEEAQDRAFKTKKDFMDYFKKYLKSVVAALKEKGKSEDEIKSFQAGVQKYFKDVITPNFKDYDFYLGESMNPDGMVVLLNYREDGVTPFVVIWKHALTEMKV